LTLPRIGIIGAKHTTLDLGYGLQRAGFKVDACLTVDKQIADKNHIAGYLSLDEPMGKLGIPVFWAQNYALSTDFDRTQCLGLNLDVLLVMGWQRLIPDWWLQSLRRGAFGMHGASKPLPFGRGRSPMNWSLIQDKKCFYTHLFRYKPGIDDGDIVAIQVFDINDFDTCKTLHYKNTIAMIRLCIANLDAILEGRAHYHPQGDSAPSYYPKRSAEDGILYWNDNTRTIYNLVRAVTHPFPGAYSFLGGRKLMIWGAQPFDTRLSWEAPSGRIVAVFEGGDFVAKTGDGALLISKHEGQYLTFADVGRDFDQPPLPRKEWENLPD
jgi:methionyl-tRNA formyltransferase